MRETVPIAVVNGITQSHVPVSDRGLAYGDGVFETMVVVGGDIPLWRFHYDRLYRGLRALKIPLEISALARQMRTVLANAKAAELKQMMLKLMVTRGEGGRGYQVPSRVTPNLIATLLPLPPDISMGSGVKVHYCQQQLSPQPLAGIKTLNQLVYVLASQERLDNNCSEGLLFNAQGHLIEATARNVFLVNGSTQLLTPRLDQCGVEGVMRRLIIDIIAPQLNIDIKQTVITKADIADARELFLTNSVTHIWPVVDCENRQWPQGPQGPLTMAIKSYLATFLRNANRLCYSQDSAMNAAFTFDR